MGVRILIVDDAPFMRLLLARTLTALGHEVVGEAEDGEQALVKFAELAPDIVTMDVVMPNMTGLDALRAIRARDHEARVVMVSAVDQREHVVEAMKHGASDYVVKPFDQECVQAAIARALRALV